jgi:transcription antitermination factor NusG
MDDPLVNWYVSFVRTGFERQVVSDLERILDCDSSLPFILQRDYVFRRQGKINIFKKICFPSYVFIESSKTPQNFYLEIFDIMQKAKNVYRFLSYGDRYDIAMRENEMLAMKKIFGSDHCIGISTGFKEGDHIRVTSGALVGHESKIIRINKNQKEVIIAFKMYNNIVNLSVGIDIIEKV